jgi:hypothetical protein
MIIRKYAKFNTLLVLFLVYDIGTVNGIDILSSQDITNSHFLCVI